VGGIAGVIGLETDLDVMEDWESYGEASLNADSKLRAVILACENHGTITGKKQNAGGIAGWQSMGLVRLCTNTGAVDGTGASYVGGISGMSTGFIRNCFVKSGLTGQRYVGGVAGSASIVTDCLTMVELRDIREAMGAVLGAEEETMNEVENPIAGNFYLSVSGDLGAIDGISYAGMAQGLALEEFLNLETLPELFRTVTIRFRFPDGTTEECPLTPGQGLNPSAIPAVPEQTGYSGVWDGLDGEDLQQVLFDRLFEVKYTALKTTIASEQARVNGRPILLVDKSLSGTQKKYLESVKERLGKIYLIGGSFAVSDGAASSLAAYRSTERVNGANRFATSEAVARKFFGSTVKAVVLAYGMNFPDGLCGGPLACAAGGPLLLMDTKNYRLAGTYISSRKPADLYVLGGQYVIPEYTMEYVID
jgi:hypothetical protein